MIDVYGYCFRHEPSVDPARMQAFRMHEYVHVGTPHGALAAPRRPGSSAASRCSSELGLAARPEVANDPFFGRAGRMLAVNQRDRGAQDRARRPASTATTCPAPRWCRQLPPVTTSARLRHHARRTARSRTRRASASAWSGSPSPCSAPRPRRPRAGPRRCGRRCGRDDDVGVAPAGDRGDVRAATRCTRADRTGPRRTATSTSGSSCCTASASIRRRRACCALGADFEGDQWDVPQVPARGPA